MAREVQLLADCIRHCTPGQGGTPPIAVVHSGVIDGPAFLTLAQQHRLVPFVHAVLKQGGFTLPAGLQHEIEQAFHVHLARNSFMVEALHMILRDCATRGIRIMPLRGPVLAARLWGDTLFRQCDDLDFLLDEKCVLDAKRILIEKGYREHHRMSPAVEQLSLRAGWEIILKSPDDRFTVELHTQMTPRSYGVRIPTAWWWTQSECREWEGEKLMELATGALYLANMVHAGKHLWERLIWLADLHELGRRMTPDQQREVLAEARAVGLSHLIQVGRSYVEQVFGSTATEQQATLNWSGQAGGRWKRLRDHARLRDGVLEQVRYWLAELCEPSYRDWISFPALHRVPVLYYGWRPLRLAADFVGGRFRSTTS